jgi:hypothetical protein
VIFPTTRSDTDTAFALPLPKGVMVTDRQLNRAFQLQQANDVQEVLKGEFAVKPFEFEGPVSVPEPAEPARAGWNWYWIVGVGCAVAAAAMAVCLIRVRKRV